MRAAWLAFAAAAACATTAAWRALRLDAPPTIASPAASGTAVGFPQPESRPLSRVLLALDRDPFHPERRRPGRRFRLPGDAAPPPAASVRGAPTVRLVGTVVLGGSASFAICQAAGGVPRRVRIGEQVGELTLVLVEPSRAVFRTAAGNEVVLHVPKAGFR